MKLRTHALVLLALSMTAAPALAVHGEAYDAYGVATHTDAQGNVQTQLVHVFWTGYCWPAGSCRGYPAYYFVVDFQDTDGNPLAKDAFPGSYQAGGPNAFLFEVLLYKGQATDAAGATHFSILGVQGQQVLGGAPNKAVMFYTGNWWDWQLQLVVPFGVAPF